MSTFPTTLTLSDGTTVQVSLSERTYDRHNKRAFRAKTRLYGAVDALSADLTAQEPRYVAYTDENSTDADREAEKAWRAWRKATLRATTKKVKEVAALLADQDDQTSVRFSYTAGCTCGCSPGYILSGVFVGRADIWLHAVEA